MQGRRRWTDEESMAPRRVFAWDDDDERNEDQGWEIEGEDDDLEEGWDDEGEEEEEEEWEEWEEEFEDDDDDDFFNRKAAGRGEWN